MLENRGEVDARGLVVEIVFNRWLNSERFRSIWPDANAHAVYSQEADAEPNLWRVTYVFAEPFQSSGPEVLAKYSLDQMEILGPGAPKVFEIKASWNARGINVEPDQHGTAEWRPG